MGTFLLISYDLKINLVVMLLVANDKYVKNARHISASMLSVELSALFI